MNQVLANTLDNLLPHPRKLTRLSADYALDDSCSIICMSPTGSIAGEHLAKLLGDEWDIPMPVANESMDDGYCLHLARAPHTMPRSRVETANMSSLRDEEYVLTVTADGVVIQARTDRALLWGAMTLRQLICSQGNAFYVKGVEIQDYPRYALRGFMIDSGRAPNSLPKLKRIIRICSAFKLNTLFFREGDDEMNAVRYSSNKLGSSNPYAFSMSDLCDLSAYARAYGIDLIPEVESLGHSTAKGIHYPELVSGGFEEMYEGIGSHIRKSHLAPCDPETFGVLASVFDELFACLGQPVIHLGLDEVRLPVEVQARHMGQLLPIVFRCAERHGIQASPIVWGDAPETPEEFKEHVCRCLWEYGDGDDINHENPSLVKQGIANLSQPKCCQKVIMAGGSGSGHTPYSKTPYIAAYNNLASWANYGNSLENHVGLFAVQWSGNMTDEWLPDFLAAADFGWTPPMIIPPHDYLDRRIRGHLSRLSDSSNPQPETVDRPAWDGIWLKGNHWDKAILPAPGKPRHERRT